MAALRQRLLIATLGLIAAGGVGLAAWQRHTTRLALESSRREAERAESEWREKLDTQAQEIRALQAQLAEARTAPSPPAAAALPTAPADAPPPPPGGNFHRAGEMAALFQKPEAMRLLALQQRGALDERYAALFRKLKLAPEALAKLQALLLDKQNTRRDVMNAAREKGLNPRENRDQIRALTEQANGEIDQAISNLLSPEQYNEYQSYEQTAPERALVQRVEERLGYAATGLTEAQSTALMNALRAQGSATAAPNGTSRGPAPSAGLSEAVIAQMQPYMTPEQIEALKQIFAEQNAQRELQEMIRENFNADNRAQAVR